MKLILTLLLLSFVTLSCEEKCEPDHSCVRVKLIRTLCGQANLQILDPAFFDRGQAWQDRDGVAFEHAFSTLIPGNMSLHFSESMFEPGFEFYIQFADNHLGDNLVQCQAYLYGPEKFSYIMVVPDCITPQE